MRKREKRDLPTIVLTIAALTLSVFALGGLTACGGKQDSAENPVKSEESNASGLSQADPGGKEELENNQTGQAGGAASGTGESLTLNWKEKAAEESLERLIEAITAQYPGETFTALSEEEIEAAGAQFSDAYYFAGKKAASGWQFAAGVCHVRENPLDGVTCGASGSPLGYSVSQFDNGRILLMEKSGKDTGLSYLYDILQHGGEGIAYLTEAAARGVFLVPPENGPFLKVSMVKQGISVNEFVPLSQEQADELQAGKLVVNQNGEKKPEQSRIALCAGREEISEKWSGQGDALTEEMALMAKERCGLDAGDNFSNFQISDIAQAEMTVNLHGELRSETIANQSDLELIEEKLNRAVRADGPLSGSYDGILTLTGRDGSQIVLQLASYGAGGFILGNAAGYSLSEEETQAVWSTFTQVDGWRKYGGQIRIVMDKAAWDEASEEFTFVLQNETGGPIQYILSPIFYKKSEEEKSAPSDKTPGAAAGIFSDGEWEQIEGVSGFCGFVTDMDGERAELSVPWKDAFVSKGAGLYKLGIQVMPEPDLRFEIGDYFELK